MTMDNIDQKTTATRISVSLPPQLAASLDSMIAERGFQNRSQAIAEMVQQQWIEHQQEKSDAIMAGTITLIYDVAKPELLQKLARIQREHIEECISSQHVQLEGQYIMEVVLVQGPVQRLREVTDRMITLKGMNSGRLTLTDKILPPVHGR